MMAGTGVPKRAASTAVCERLPLHPPAKRLRRAMAGSSCVGKLCHLPEERSALWLLPAGSRLFVAVPRLHPGGDALLVFFDLPEGRLGLKPVDEEAAGFEGGIPVWAGGGDQHDPRSEEHTSELQSRGHLVCRRLL